MDISSRLKELRTTIGLTIVDIQHICAMNKAQYFKYEQGINHPSLNAIIKIISAFEISLDDFNSNTPISHLLTNEQILQIQKKRYNRRYNNPQGQYDYSSRLKELRQYYQMSVNEFAAYCHIHKDQYARYERKKNLPTVSGLIKILSHTPFTKEEFYSSESFSNISTKSTK